LFTGIVEELGRVRLLTTSGITIGASKVLQETNVGDSIAVNGVCLTVTSLGNDYLATDLMPETLRRSNLGLLKTGDSVNLERALTLLSRIGGHLVQGHIDGTGKIINRNLEQDAVVMRFETTPEIMRYIVRRGFVAVDGISLTVTERDERSFTVSLVQHTQMNTTLFGRKTGDTVNIENDIIAKYVEALTGAPSGGVTLDFLQEHGF